MSHKKSHRNKYLKTLLGVGFLGILCPWMAQSAPVQKTPYSSPYIDAIHKKLNEQDVENQESNPDLNNGSSKRSYTEIQKQSIQNQDEINAKNAQSDGTPALDYNSTDYTKKIKENLAPVEETDSYSKQEQEQLIKKSDEKDDDPSSKSAIDAVKKGKSELKMKRVGKINTTGGFRFGVNSTRDVEADESSRYRRFSDVYEPGKTPDFQIFYEYQPLRSDTWGSLGLYTSLGLNHKTGYGRFLRAPYDPSQQNMGAAENASGRKSELTDIKYTFITLPVSVGLAYRLLVARWIVPYVILAPTAVIYTERRSNPRESQWGRSNGLTQILGVALAMDWIEKAASWSMYEALGVKRIFFNIDYYRLSNMGNNEIRFTTSAIFAGFSFDI